MLRGLFRLGLFCAVVPALAQITVPVGVDLFGDGIVTPLKSSGAGPFVIVDSVPVKEPKQIPNYEHTLFFQDGRHVAGTLVELTKDEVVWSRPDMEPPLRIARNEVRRITFKPQTSAGFSPDSAPEEASGKSMPATVKLPGTDWLFGDVRSENGDTFSVEVSPGNTLTFSRQAVQWLYFAKQPVPAFGFAGEPLGMEGWIFGNPAVPGEVVDGTFKLQGSGWIGRDISPPDRFVVDFVVPKGVEPTRLWLQPYRPSPNSYSTGTIELAFSAKEMSRLIFINRFERERTPFTTPAGDGPMRYRVFYDRQAGRVAVMRNDEVVGDWKLREKDDPAMGGDDSRSRAPKGICFDRGQTNSPLQLNRVSMQPWDGVLPKAGAAPEPRLIASGTVTSGKLESIAASEVTVAGEKKPRSTGTFIDLAQAPASLREANALVTFGAKGELAVADLEVRDGSARARAAAFEKFQLPVNLIDAIAFPSRKSEPKPDTDTLVFRNGDSMSGKLVKASKDNAIQWKAPHGQELTLKAEHIAGVHFGGIVPTEVDQGATIELLSGDRVRAKLEGLDTAELRAHHAVFGPRTIPRNLLRAVYPSSKSTVLDAGSDPESWLGLANRRKADLRVLAQVGAINFGRVFLDGVFLNPPAQGSSWNYTGISQVIKDRERYELRCEVTDAGGAEPYLTGSLAGNNGTPSLQINLGHGQLRVYSYNLGGARGRPVQQEREVPLADKVPQQKTRRELRIFVDTKSGTADFMVDGVYLLRFGQQKNERAPGLGSQINLSTYSMSGNMSMLSNVWLGPWNGEVPRLGDAINGACLNNGDFAPGAIGKLSDGKLTVGEGADGFEIPIDRVSSLDFGGEASPLRPAARLRLADGTVLNLQDFRWDEGKIHGESPAFGTIQLPAKAVSELIFSPAPARFPKLAEPKKLTKKKGENENENAE